MIPSEIEVVKQYLNEQALPTSYGRLVDHYIAPLAAQLSQWQTAKGQPLVVGVNGAQGTGKSTLCGVVNILMAEHFNLSSVVISIDDFYCTRAQRQQLAEDEHALLQTRGVPGTHQVALGIETINALLAGESIKIPRFDKALDDQLPDKQQIFQNKPVDIVLFEGWCIAAKPQPFSALGMPINRLERDEDADGRWRHYVNEALASEYQALFALIDKLVMLKAPSMSAVFEWRNMQEQKLAERVGKAANNQVMTAEQVARFVEHYERLTRFMLQDMPERSDVVLYLSNNHEIYSMSGLSSAAKQCVYR